VAVLCEDGRLNVFRIDDLYSGRIQNNSKRQYIATCMCIATCFLVYTTEGGDVCFVHLDTMQSLKPYDFNHPIPIAGMATSRSGTQLVFFDLVGNGFIFDAMTKTIVPINDGFPHDATTVLFDQAFGNVIYAFDGRALHTFVVSLQSIRGASVVKFGNTSIGAGGEVSIDSDDSFLPMADSFPIVACKGAICCLSSQKEEACNIFSSVYDKENEDLMTAFTRHLVLQRYDDAFKDAESLGLEPCFKALANKAMESMDLSKALKVFEHLQDAAMVSRLETLSKIDEKTLQSANIAVLFTDYDLAEEKYLVSSQPEKALAFRCDFAQWQSALSLAQDSSPQDVVRITLKLAGALESESDYKGSLLVLEKAMKHSRNLPREQKDAVLSAIAKLSLKLGDLKKGMFLVNEIGKPQLFLECGPILEEMGDEENSAMFYNLGGDIENAARLYMLLKNMDKVKSLLKSTDKTLPKRMYSDFAALCENQGDYDLSVEAYCNANEYSKAMDICLRVLHDTSKALQLAQDCNDVDAIVWASEWCSKRSDERTAVRFLLTGNLVDEALALAKKNKCVDIVSSAVGDNMSSKHAEEIGCFYEQLGHLRQAAIHFGRVPKFQEKAIVLLLEEDRVPEAIFLIQESMHMHDLGQLLVEHLLRGDTTHCGSPKYLVQAYLFTANVKEASKITTSLLADLMSEGEYDDAHSIVCEIVSDMHAQQLSMPSNVREKFVLLHSYQIAKQFVRARNHKAAAHLLNRVSNDYHTFALQDQFNVLLSTVLECENALMNVSRWNFTSLPCSFATNSLGPPIIRFANSFNRKDPSFNLGKDYML